MKDNGSAQDCRHKENYIGRQTRETQLEPLKQWLRNKMGGDRQSTWEHMAPNKQQAMYSTDRDIWWPAWAHQQDRDNNNNIYYILLHVYRYTFIYTQMHLITYIYIYIYKILLLHCIKINRNNTQLLLYKNHILYLELYFVLYIFILYIIYL